jgi:HPt (histidine-containing phosphotransfer) domain-containing protein
MNPINPDSFEFDKAIDAEYLQSLYENDYQYIAEIFKTAIDHYDEDVDAIVANYSSGNLDGLKRAIHKIKPSFGFIGMPRMQQQCKDFEDACVKATSVGEITTGYQKILDDLVVCKQILETDYQKLIVYNQSL